MAFSKTQREKKDKLYTKEDPVKYVKDMVKAMGLTEATRVINHTHASCLDVLKKISVPASDFVKTVTFWENANGYINNLNKKKENK
jgi:hypothetical protein